MPRELEYQKYLASIFVVDPAWGSSPKFAKWLAEVLNAQGIDVSPVPLETPSEAPPEAPRVALISATRSWQVFASFVRIDINLFPANLGESEGPLSNGDFWEASAQLFSRVLKEKEFDVNRLAGVLEASADTTEEEGTPDDYVRRRFLSSDLPACLDSDRYNCEAHVYQRPTWNTGEREILLNKIFRIKALHANTPKGKRNALFIEVDCNTTPDEPSIRLSEEELRSFYAQIPDRINSTIKSCLEETET